MRVLHLFSNHKWTGPADHALNLVAGLARLPGLQPFLACGRRPGSANQLQAKAGQHHLKLVHGYHMSKHLDWRIMADILRLRRQIKAGSYDLVHSHLVNDTLTSALAGAGPRMVSSVYAGDPAELNWRQRASLSRAALVLTASSRVRDFLTDRLPGKAVRHLDVPVDLTRFAPRPKQRRLLNEFGFGPQTPVAGIVARVQRHRRFDLLLRAVRQAADRIPEFRFLIIGRGTLIDELARRPVARLGLEDRVVFAGYRGEDYPAVLNILDFKLFLIPGSDGACRAVREALACGKPVLASRRGILPELISDGHNGRLVEQTPESISEAIVELCRDRSLLQRWAGNAREYALRHFDPDKYVSEVVDGYRQVLRSRS